MAKQQSFLNFPTNTLNAAPEPTTVAVPVPSAPIRPDAPVSVSEQTRIAKEALKQEAIASILMGEGGAVPVTGNYYDAIRARQQVRTSAPANLTNQFVRGLYNKKGGVKSFAAANYDYPSQQMVIGAALAGLGSSPTQVERLGRIVGDTYVAPFPNMVRSSYSSSPSEERARQMAGLLGLNGNAMTLKKEDVGPVVSAFVSNNEILKTARDLIRQAIKALNDNFGFDLDLDFDKFFENLADYMHQQQVDALQVLVNTFGGSVGGLGYTALKDKLPGFIVNGLTFTTPEPLRRDWAAQMYKAVWGADPKVDKLDKLLKDDNYALASDFAGAAKAIGKPKFDPDAAATPPAGGSSGSGAGTGSGGRGGAVTPRLPGVLLPGMLRPRPGLIKPLPIRPTFIQPVAPAKSGSNTALIVGGVAAVAVVAYFVMSRKKAAAV
jgi:hypothetical protein